MSQQPQTIDDLWPNPWLKCEHLPPQGAVVTIKKTSLEMLRPNGKPEQKLVVEFEKATRKLVCNKTQGYRLAEITGTKKFGQWVGCRVRLTRGKAHNGKPTIIIDPAPSKELR